MIKILEIPKRPFHDGIWQRKWTYKVFSCSIVFTFGMPNFIALHIHFLTISKVIPASTTSCTSWMELISTGLQNLSSNKFIAFVAFNTVFQIVVPQAKWLSFMCHIFALKNSGTFRTFETPHMPGLVKGEKHLSTVKLIATGSTR